MSSEFNWMEVFEELSNITEKMDKLDMENIDDLKVAYDNVLRLEEILNELGKDNLYESILGLITLFFGIDYNEEISKYKDILKSAIDKHENSKSCKCDKCSDCEFFDGEKFNNVIEITPEYVKDNLSFGEYDNIDDEKDTYCKLIAEYFNDELPYLCYNSEEIKEERENIIFMLYDFINYIMNK